MDSLFHFFLSLGLPLDLDFMNFKIKFRSDAVKDEGWLHSCFCEMISRFVGLTFVI